MKNLLRSFLTVSGIAAVSLLSAPLFAGQVNLTAPQGSVRFGESVKALPSGNIVVTDPGFNAGAITAAGAVYVFTPNGVLLTTLTGSTNNDCVGGIPVTGSSFNGGVTVLANGNFVVVSPAWHGGLAGAVAGAGAITWVNGTTGLPYGATGSTNVVSAANSLVGTHLNDGAGGHGITPLPSGHFVATSADWDNGNVADAGAVTWGNGLTGSVVGEISAANSLVGSSADDVIGYYGIVVLTNGNYVVQSLAWDSEFVVNPGAATWGSGTSGVRGVVSAANSLVGTNGNDLVGQVTPLTNGNYVVSSPYWDLDVLQDVGAVTWAKGTGGTVGAISKSNSLIGSFARDNVGLVVIALTNGHYVVGSENWNGAVPSGVGAVTWGNGAKGTTGVVSGANSLVGTKAADHISSAGLVALTNGHYVVASDKWDGDTPSNAGAATWCNGNTGTTIGQITAANSLIGTQTDDQVGMGGIVALSNGNYVVVSPTWKNGTVARCGAVTWGNGAIGIKGAVATANSLYGNKLNDLTGSTGVYALNNGNYVVSSERWGDGSFNNMGAVTWGNGATGIKGLVSAANSLVGSHADDKISGYNNSGFGIVPLTNGNYVIVSPYWNNGAAGDVGAVTWATGTAASTGPLSAANSLIGSTNASAGLVVSSGQSVFPLANGNYVVTSPYNDADGFSTTGAVTWGNGAAGISGPISLANSLNGAAPAPAVSGITALANGDYIVHFPKFAIHGAVALGDGHEGSSGAITAANSVLGVAPQDGLYTDFSYNANWKQLVVGQSDCNLVTLFTYPAPKLQVEQPVATVIADGGSTDFGGVLTGKNTSLEFTVTNTGETAFTALTLSTGGGHRDDFTVTSPPAATLAPGASTTFMLKFAPLAAGARVGSFHLNTGEFTQSSYDVIVTGVGITPVPPLATTVAVDIAGVGVTTATVKGSVNANDSERTVVFQYGKALGTAINYTDEVAATPGSVDGTALTNVSAALTGLDPHSKYNYRVKAFGFLGEAVGLNMTFTTLNSAPVAVDDAYVILPGAKATLDILTNDNDPDGDARSLVSISALNPKTAGTIAKVGDTVVFTTAAAFNGAATFDYVIKDVFGKTDTGTVTLTPGACTLDPASKLDLLSASGSYLINVNVTGGAAGYWSVGKPPPWVTVSPMFGSGDGQVIVTYQPNAAKTSRTGVIMIGGQAHTLTQAKVLTPSLSAPTVPLAVVGDLFTMTIPTTGAPVTYTVTNLPAGLKMDNATGTISGIPTKGIDYLVKVKAANAAGAAPQVLEFHINVQPLPAGVVGSFHGFIKREGTVNSGLGSRIELTTTATGGFTGKIITGVTSQALKGTMKTFPGDVKHPQILQQIRPGLALNLTLSSDDDRLTGSYGDGASHDAAVSGWHNAWTTVNKATAFIPLHTFSLELDDTAAALPQGYGYGSFSAKDTTGAVTVAGKLADGSVFTTATFVSKDGKVLVYQPLYTNKGTFAGVLSVDPGTQKVATTNDDLTWLKPAPANPAASTDTVYKTGFGPLDVIAAGGTYIPPAKGKVVMNLKNNTPQNAQLDFTPNGLDPHFSIDLEIDNPSATGLTNKVKTPIPNNTTYKVNLPTLTAATGLFGGDFTFTAVPATNTRKVTFSGIIVNNDAGTHGYGFFLTPETPDAPGETIAKTPKTSGRVMLNALITEGP